ncbi:MAG: imidazole glycerol phosphate synthase subunit HisH [Verrucomicrobiae bacterium]|nr:imidazole glycerol phosphate synthase subunit HisH [Verrucomicrobiae bacterium]
MEKALARVGGEVCVVCEPHAIRGADAVVLPGVGAFGDCVRGLARLGLVGALREFIARGRPFLGICVGLQMLLEESEESPGVAGLGIFRGAVRRFRDGGLKVPHMGWNRLMIRRSDCPLLRGLADGAYVYFVHSYFAEPSDGDAVAATSNYGGEFAAVLWQDNVFGVQFHPEKSQGVGLAMLRNFVEML